jgi:hypothetical protein
MKLPRNKPLKPAPWKDSHDYEKYPGRRPCPHPDCPIPFRDPWRESQCVLNKPIGIYIPPGEHIHLECPVHPGGHVMYGSPITFMEVPMEKRENNLPDPSYKLTALGGDILDSSKPFCDFDSSRQFVDYDASSKTHFVDYDASKPFGRTTIG